MKNRLEEILKVLRPQMNHSNPATADLFAAEIFRLRKIVAKLPVTADGVPIVPGMMVYSRDGHRHRVEAMIDRNLLQMYPSKTTQENGLAHDYYSTRKAALAAKGK